MSDVTLLVLLKAAYLFTGLVLCLVGKSLIEKKLQSRFQGEGSISKSSIKVVTTSPGMVFLVAGFIVIGTAIVQKTEISESYREESSGAQSAGRAKDDRPRTETLRLMAQKARTISFAQQGESSPSVRDMLSRGRSFAREGRLQNAAVQLSMAVVVEPASLTEILDDPALAAAVQQPEFDAIVRARFALPLHPAVLPPGTMSAAAEEVLARLRSVAGRVPRQAAAEREARELARRIPAAAGTEPKRDTIARLISMLEKAPHVLLEKIDSPEQRWMLSDPEIVEALETSVDRRIRNE
ncbi:MAG TPA: hypothetical protein VFB01_11920 [Burkholderiales bacterium]|nr:hypothetical protein [Burkholderiales bacterium]